MCLFMLKKGSRAPTRTFLSSQFHAPDWQGLTSKSICHWQQKSPSITMSFQERSPAHKVIVYCTTRLIVGVSFVRTNPRELRTQPKSRKFNFVCHLKWAAPALIVLSNNCLFSWVQSSTRMKRIHFASKPLLLLSPPFVPMCTWTLGKKINFSGLALNCKVGKSMMSIFQFPNDMVE